MIIYFDLDKKEWVNPPGFGGNVRSASFVRGDYTPLEVHFLKGGVEVTDVTNIVFIIKAAPGPASPSLATADEWENPDETTHFTALLNLNGEALDTLLGTSTSKSLLCQLSCHQAGSGPISSQLVTAKVGGDLHRGDEGSPPLLDDPEEWLEERRPAPLELDAPPVDGSSSFVVSGITTPLGANDTYVESGAAGGKTRFVDETSGIYSWEWSTINSRWELTNDSDVLFFRAAQNVASPALVTIPFTAAGTGAGTLVVTTIGTAATALDQKAIVTTTNASGTFEDVWTCVRVSPVKWNPPGNIFKDRDTGIYHRQFVRAAVPTLEEAYPA